MAFVAMFIAGISEASCRASAPPFQAIPPRIPICPNPSPASSAHPNSPPSCNNSATSRQISAYGLSPQSPSTPPNARSNFFFSVPSANSALRKHPPPENRRDAAPHQTPAAPASRGRILERLYIDNCLPFTVELFRQLAFFILSCKPISYCRFKRIDVYIL